MTFLKNNWRFLFIAFILISMWAILIVGLYLKADEVTKHPCTICAEQQGDKVSCTVNNYLLQTRTYYPNGSIKTQSVLDAK